MPNILHPEKWKTVAHIKDDGGPVTFRWHFPRGTLAPRMSALELCEFLFPHMPAIVPLLAHHPRAQMELKAMMVCLTTKPHTLVDQLLPWIRSVTRTEDADLIIMNLHEQTPLPCGPAYFVL
jgi:hypothetical protein